MNIHVYHCILKTFGLLLRVLREKTLYYFILALWFGFWAVINPTWHKVDLRKKCSVRLLWKHHTTETSRCRDLARFNFGTFCSPLNTKTLLLNHSPCSSVLLHAPYIAFSLLLVTICSLKIKLSHLCFVFVFFFQNRNNLVNRIKNKTVILFFPAELNCEASGLGFS